MKMKLNASLSLLLLLLTPSLMTSCGTAIRSPQPSASPLSPAIRNWAEVLQKHVNDRGQIDFHALSKDRQRLDDTLAWIAQTSPTRDPQAFKTSNERLAYYLNSYNALAMANVLDEGIPENIGGFKTLKVFEFKRFLMGGEYKTLFQYENFVIRPLGEERVHFALNCMVRGCPRLPRKPFTAERLQQELDENARLFLNESRNVQVDHANKTVRFSSILKFYTADFLAKAPSLIAYANRYRKEQIPSEYRIDFIPYDWTVNVPR